MKILWIALFVAPPAFAIVGGQTPGAQDPVRGVTVVVSNSGQSDNCTGTKIAPNYILTAGHCKNLAEVIYTSDGKKVQVVQKWNHPKWAPNTKDSYDFAILKISPGLPGPYAKIADASTTPKKGDKVWLAGYGDTQPGVWSDPSLNKISVNVDDPDFSPSGIAVEGHNYGPCAGDSGGPGYIMKNGQVIVWGADSADKPDSETLCGGGEIYAKVVTAHDWIQSVLAGKQPVMETATVKSLDPPLSLSFIGAPDGSESAR